MDPVNVSAKFEVRSFTRSRDNSDWSFGRGLRTSNLGKGTGNGTVQKSVSYRPSKVTFPLSLRVSEISPLLCSSTPVFFHPTFSLPKISPCSPGSRWMAFGLRRTKMLS